MGIKGLLSKLLAADDSLGQSEGATETKYSQGIGSNGATPTSNRRGSALHARRAAIAFWTRLFALFAFFLSLCLAIALTVFQKKWIGAPSGLSGFLLFCISSFILILAILTFAPVAANRSQGKKIAEIERALREELVGIVLMAWCLGMGFILCLTQLVSSLVSKACKDPSADPHAKSSLGNDDDYVKALGSFCGTKRATAAFLWMGWVACLGLSVVFLLDLRQSRKAGPRIPPFVHPGGESEGAFQAIDAEDHEDDDPHAYGKGAQSEDYATRYRGYDDQYHYTAAAPATPAPPGFYRNPLSDVQAKYGLTQPLSISHVTYDPPQPTTGQLNPFAEALANAQPLMVRPAAPPYGHYGEPPSPVSGYDTYGGEYASGDQHSYKDDHAYQQQYTEHAYPTQTQYAEVEYQPRQYGGPGYQTHGG